MDRSRVAGRAHGRVPASSRPSPLGAKPACTRRGATSRPSPSTTGVQCRARKWNVGRERHVGAAGDLHAARRGRDREDRQPRPGGPVWPRPRCRCRSRTPRPRGSWGDEAQVGRALEGAVDLGAAAEGRRADGGEVLRAQARPRAPRPDPVDAEARPVTAERVSAERRTCPPPSPCEPSSATKSNRWRPSRPRARPRGGSSARQRASYWPGAADDHAVLGGDEALRAVGGRAAAHADRERLVDVLGDRHELGHRLERPAAVVLVEAGHDDAHARGWRASSATSTSEASKNWPSSIPTTSVSGATSGEDLGCAVDHLRGHLHLGVADDLAARVAGVDPRLEQLHASGGRSGPGARGG